MSRYFLFGTLMWQDLLAEVAGTDAGCVRATLDGWAVEQAAAGDWPVLVPGAGATGYLTAPLDGEAKARLDWYEVAFGYVPEAVTVIGPDGPVAALVYREAGGAGGAGVPWKLTDWVADHGIRTRLAAAEIIRARGRKTPAELIRLRGIIQARAHAIATVASEPQSVTVGQDMGADQIEVLSVEYPYDGFQRIEEWTVDHPRFDGTRSGPITRMITQSADAATVLPYDPVRDRVLLVEQVRIGALAKGDPSPWMLEPPAGLIDAGETAETTVIREAQEEAGINITSQDLHFVGRYYPTPGGVAQILYSYVALVDLPDGTEGLHGLASESEDIRGHLVSLDDLLAMIPTGEAANAPLILSAQWIALNRTALRG